MKEESVDAPEVKEESVDAPEVKEESTAPEVEEESITPEVKEETTAPEVKAVEAKPQPKPHYVEFFEQYVNLAGKRPDQAIKAYNNCIKSMLNANTNAAFNTVFGLLKENKHILTTNVALQSIATLPANERAVVEVVTTIFHVMVTNPKAPVNLDTARNIVKKDPFITWCAKKLA